MGTRRGGIGGNGNQINAATPGWNWTWEGVEQGEIRGDRRKKIAKLLIWCRYFLKIDS